MYFDPDSPSSIQGMRTDLVDNSQVHVRVKAGGEGTVVFDSAIALLQALFPPTPMNKIDLANGTTIVAPLGGYQYVPGTHRFYYQDAGFALTFVQLRRSNPATTGLWRAGQIAR